MYHLDCSNYEKFIKFCELKGYDLKDFQKELARSVLEGNNHYLILPRQNGRKSRLKIQEVVYEVEVDGRSYPTIPIEHKF